MYYILGTAAETKRLKALLNAKNQFQRGNTLIEYIHAQGGLCGDSAEPACCCFVLLKIA